MIEIGYLAASQNFYHKLVANVSIYNQKGFRKTDYLETEHFVSAFLLYVGGVVVSVIAFIIEVYKKRLATNIKKSIYQIKGHNIEN